MQRGTLTEANFAQNKIKSDRSFSEDGQKVYSELAGTPIKTVDDLAGALRAGTIKPNQLPVDYVDMNGARLILNTRTSTALEQAAILEVSGSGEIRQVLRLIQVRHSMIWQQIS